MSGHGGDIFGTARRHGWDWQDVLDFSANINPLGMPGSVRAAITQAWGRVEHYPEISSPGLREAAAAAWGVRPQQILAGNGATELLYFLARVLRPGKIHLVEPDFSEYRCAFREAEISTTARDAGEGYRIDFATLTDDLRRAAAEWVVFSNPNNPTGAAASREELLAWLEDPLPAGVRVLIDESFVEFAPELSMAGTLERAPGLMLLRSLTKFYALPGLRAGCLLADERTITMLEAFREPWQVNILAEQGVVAALNDQDYHRSTVEFVRREREWLRDRLAALGWLRPLPGAANYVFAESNRPAGELQEFLLERKILIRNCTRMPGISGEALRVAVRTRAENERLIEALEGWR